MQYFSHPPVSGQRRFLPFRPGAGYLVLGLGITLLALFIACGPPDAGPSPAPSQEAGTPSPLLGSQAIATARAKYQNASPNLVVSTIPGGWFEDLTIKKGTTVVWINEDINYHSVTANEYDSGSMHIGDTFSHTFDRAGVSRIICLYHGSMRGTVTVVDS